MRIWLYRVILLLVCAMESCQSTKQNSALLDVPRTLPTYECIVSEVAYDGTSASRKSLIIGPQTNGMMYRYTPNDPNGKFFAVGCRLTLQGLLCFNGQISFPSPLFDENQQAALEFAKALLGGEVFESGFVPNATFAFTNLASQATSSFNVGCVQHQPTPPQPRSVSLRACDNESACLSTAETTSECRFILDSQTFSEGPLGTDNWCSLAFRLSKKICAAFPSNNPPKIKGKTAKCDPN